MQAMRTVEKASMLRNIQISDRGKYFILLILGLLTGLNVIDTSMMGNAMPIISAELGGEMVYAFLFTVKNLLNAVFLLLSGKCSDLFGRKKMLMWGTLVVMTGYAAASFSSTIESLILARAIAGVGSGIVMGVSYVIIGDLFRGTQSAKAYSTIIVATGSALILGPVLGGYLAEHFAWQWIFLVLLPVILFVLILQIVVIPNYRVDQKKRTLDTKGLIYFTVGISALMLLLSFANTYFSWKSLPAFLLLMIAALFLMLFFLHEGKVDEKIAIMPMQLMKQRFYWTACIAQMLVTVSSCILMIYLPLYVQNVMKESALNSGLLLGFTYLLSSVLGVILTRMVVKSAKSKTYCIVCCLIQVLFISAIAIVVHPQIPMLYLYIFLAGYSFGSSMDTFIFVYSVQKKLSGEQMSVGSSGIAFMQGLGAMVGIAIGGTVMALFQNQIDWALRLNFILAASFIFVGMVLIILFMPMEKEVLKKKRIKVL